MKSSGLEDVPISQSFTTMAGWTQGGYKRNSKGYLRKANSFLPPPWWSLKVLRLHKFRMKMSQNNASWRKLPNLSKCPQVDDLLSKSPPWTSHCQNPKPRQRNKQDHIPRDRAKTNPLTSLSGPNCPFRNVRWNKLFPQKYVTNTNYSKFPITSFVGWSFNVSSYFWVILWWLISSSFQSQPPSQYWKRTCWSGSPSLAILP